MLEKTMLLQIGMSVSTLMVMLLNSACSAKLISYYSKYYLLPTNLSSAGSARNGNVKFQKEKISQI
jgi:hypothetical protein